METINVLKLTQLREFQGDRVYLGPKSKKLKISTSDVASSELAYPNRLGVIKTLAKHSGFVIYFNFMLNYLDLKHILDLKRISM
jgi:hypothetical protein